jgi:hypothetical protein
VTKDEALAHIKAGKTIGDGHTWFISGTIYNCDNGCCEEHAPTHEEIIDYVDEEEMEDWRVL